MSKRSCGGVLIVLAVFFLGLTSANGSTINYGSFTLNPGFTATNWSDRWDLTKGDLTLSYTINMSSISQSAPGNTSYTEVGIRQTGAGNFNPGPWNTYQGGAGGWMTSLVGDLTPSPGTQSLFDKHNLSASGGRGEGDYDASSPSNVVAPFGSTSNYGIWFDRDGVDQYQAANWGSVNGGTYNTNGLYNIAISYHAINSTLGTMFATVNGVQTGFYPGGWVNAQPGIYPAGLSFKGNMADMQVFAGLWAPDSTYGPVYLSNLTVVGSPVPIPAAAWLLGTGLIGLVMIRRRMKK